MVSRRRRLRAGTAAYVSGVLLVLTGGTGAVAALQLGWDAASGLSPLLGTLLLPLFIVAYAVAALGGFSVIAGGYMIGHLHRRGGKVLVSLGSGAGLLGFGLHLFLVAAAGGNPAIELVTTALSLHGLGVLLAVYAQLTG